MGDFDYGAEAELFPGLARGARRPPVSYRRFSRAAEATDERSSFWTAVADPAKREELPLSVEATDSVRPSPDRMTLPDSGESGSFTALRSRTPNVPSTPTSASTNARNVVTPNCLRVQVSTTSQATIAVSGSAGTIAGPISSVRFTRNVNA